MRNSDVGLNSDELLAMVREMFGTYKMGTSCAEITKPPLSGTQYSGTPVPTSKKEMEEHRDSRGSFGFYDPNRRTK